MAHIHSSRRSGCRQIARGFTLIELLVVIGIITVLLSILIPVVSSVRTAGYVARTDMRISTLVSAIENYQQVFGSYPGPLREDELFRSTGANGGNMPTATENLALGLLGWLDATLIKQPAPQNQFAAYDSSKVSQGPASLNPLKPKQYAAFIDPAVGGLDTQTYTKANKVHWRTWGDPARPELASRSYYNDTEIPEFVDAFPGSMPILYIRAKVGASGVILGYPTAKTIPAYDPAQLAPYAFPPPDPASPGTPGAINNNTYSNVDPQVVKDYPQPHLYFSVPGSPNSPRQKDGYLLISAGADRKFMTADDRRNGGSK